LPLFAADSLPETPEIPDNPETPGYEHIWSRRHWESAPSERNEAGIRRHLRSAAARRRAAFAFVAANPFAARR